MKLSKTEEQLMELIWSKGKLFLKDLMDLHSDPKPAPSTIATLLKRMQDKGFVGYKLYGNSREYFPLIKKEAYFSKHVKGIIKNYFSNSAIQFASFFTTNANLSEKELEDLKSLIEQEIQKRKK
ncbi:MAG TPA: BlaI/MecI/CopY family transcriptional regulator [Flavisolibacter sp.]|jgi:predicted transcriptional regulator